MTLSRAERLDLLRRKKRTQVLVIGGGINGIGVFRELALNGVDVVLVDKGDFMSGASSAPSRMIHGGLRYLENGEFALVKESLRERNLLLENAPHLVSPLPTLIPLADRFSGMFSAALRFFGGNVAPGGRGALIVKLGLTLYDLYAGSAAGMPRHRFFGRKETRRRWPALRADLVGSAIYHDARISHPERLGIEILLDCESAVGALALNHVELESVTPSGAVLRDAIDGQAFTLEPDIIVNASGAWVDLVNRSIAGRPPRLIGGTKGSHIVIANDRLRDALGGAMVYFANREGRVCILFEHLGNLLAGSTDISVDLPDGVRCEPDEVDYILASVREVFPGIEVTTDQIVYRFAGVRPLPFAGDKVNANISRDHSCEWLDGDVGTRPVLNLIGGKWTTFRAFGAEAADLVMQRLGVERRIATRNDRIGGGIGYPEAANRAAWIADFARQAGISPDRATALLDRYGTRARLLPQAGGRFLASLPGYTRAEIEWLVADEHVVALADLVLRRLTVAFTLALSLAAIEELADIAAEKLGWDDSRRLHEVATLLAELEDKHGLPRRHLASRNPHGRDDDVRREEGSHEPPVGKRQMS